MFWSSSCERNTDENCCPVAGLVVGRLLVVPAGEVALVGRLRRAWRLLLGEAGRGRVRGASRRPTDSGTRGTAVRAGARMGFSPALK